MQQATLEKPGMIRFDEVAVTPPGPGEVQIHVKQIGICGSDIHVWHGTHPFTPYPVIQGHEFMGVIAAIGPNATQKFAIGTQVTALPQIVCGECNPCKKKRFNICEQLKVRGFQAAGCAREYYNIPAERIVVLPDNFSTEQGAFVEPVAVAVHACQRAGDLRGRNVVVQGAGTIGNLIAQVAKARGAAQVLITDIADFRLDLAKRCGADYAVNTQKTSLKEAAQAAFGEQGFDLAFEAAGAEASLGAVVHAIEKGGKVLIVGVYGKAPVVDMSVVGEHEIVLAGSMMYWRDDWEEAVKLLASSVQVAPLVSRHFAFHDWADAYRFIDENGASSVKIMVDL